jgi:membrane protein
VLAVLIFLAGSAGLRAYIHFVLDHNQAYAALAAPIAALLFFFVLALGVLLGAELNAAIEQGFPSKAKPPRVLRAGGWRQFRPDHADAPDPDPAANPPAADPAGAPVAAPAPSGLGHRLAELVSRLRVRRLTNGRRWLPGSEPPSQ